MKKKLLTIALAMLALPSVCGAYGGEEFYVCHGGDGTLPQSGICAYAWDEADYNTVANFTNSDTLGDGRVGWGDTVLLLDDGGKLTQLTTPLYGNKFTLKAATGESPIISSSTTWGLGYLNAGKSNLTIGPGITFENWQNGYYAIKIIDPISNVRITGNRFLKSDATSESYAVLITMANAATGALIGSEIDNNYFNLNKYVHAIQYTFGQTTALNRPGNWNTHHNGFYNVRTGERHFLSATNQAYVLENNLGPYNVKFDDNYGDHSQAALFAPMAGMSEVDGESSVSRNIFEYCGAADRAAVNCLQLYHTVGTDIERNHITHANTLTCDGYFIILDWAAVSDSYLSGGNTVQHNILEYPDAACGGGGISAYKSVNDIIDHNVVIGVGTDRAYRVGSNESSGAVFMNNTAIGSMVCFSQADADGIGNTVTWINNICDSPTAKGFSSLDNSVAVESYNLVYNAPANDITLDATDITVDPHLDGQGRPALNSPVINAGTDVGLPYWGSAPEIGAYEVGGYPVKINNIPYTMPVWRLGVQ